MDRAPQDPRQAAARRALREALALAAREAGAAQAQLQAETARFTAVGQQVVGVVGGSAQQVDRELVQSLEEAAQRTGFAIAALGSARSSAGLAS